LVNCFPDTGAARPAHIAVVGIEAYVYTRDPTNSAFEGGQTDGQDLFRMVGQDPIENYLIEDCAFRFASDVWAQAAGRRDGAVSENVEFRRNIVESMWSPHSETEWKKPMGLVMYRADGFLCDENVFYEVGKVDEIDHAKCNFLSHAIYLGVNGETKVTNYTVKGNYFVDSGHGFKGQADGRVEDNYFERDCVTNIAAATSSFESEPASLVTYNVKLSFAR
jgi:hypothetical protein